jgi:hypothetical protein
LGQVVHDPHDPHQRHLGRLRPAVKIKND